VRTHTRRWSTWAIGRAGTLRLYRVVYVKHLAPLGGEAMRALADDSVRIRELDANLRRRDAAGTLPRRTPVEGL
jgi:hypothetical protein